MNCPHCAEKDERIAWLESELGLQKDGDAYANLRNVLMTARTPTSRHTGSAGCVMALYHAKGRTMTRLQILEACPSPSGIEDRVEKVVDVWICFARKSLGREAIESVWGRGYRLTPMGVERVGAIIGGAGA